MFRCPYLLVIALSAAPLPAVAGDAGTADTGANDTAVLAQDSVPVSGYPKSWCIKSWLAARPGSRRTSATTRPPPSVGSYRSETPLRVDDGPIDYSDRTSLISRLKALRHAKFATLWRSRDRALVLGIQDGGYIGVSLDDPRTDDD